jgi:hypothetical protein
VFGFHSEYSHGRVEELVLADEPVKQWLTNLKESGVLDSTLLIVMSDHGHRFSFTRDTLQGKYEERLPFQSVVVPKWFRTKYPEAYSSLKVNGKDRLITPFDVHQTLDTILEVVNKGLDIPLKHEYKGQEMNRGLSLFSEIPQERTCADAQISNHWCSCLNWLPVDSSDALASRAAQSIVDSINEMLKEKFDVCEKLELDKITRSQKMIPNHDMLAFKGAKDHDGYVPDLTGNTKVSEIHFEIQLSTKPNKGLFESTVKYMVEKDHFVVEPREISRVNLYGTASHCIASKLPHLSKFCYCKIQKKADSNSYINVIMG